MARVIEIRAGWKENNPLIGHLYIESIRGEESQSFVYDINWLSNNISLILSPDIALTHGRQYPAQGRKTFGFLSDAAPDRWGRKLIELEKQAFSREQGRPVPRLLESDYLLRVSDQGRTGGLRFWENGVFLTEQEDAVPPITQLRELEAAVREYEDKRSAFSLRRLIQPGSSLGGARPKANVVDELGNIWIAKFPSKHDDVSVAKWEAVTNELAAKCGLKTTATKLIDFKSSGGIFLSKRFDREYSEGNARRIHFASAMTMLDTVDGAEEKNSYLYLAEKVEELSHEPAGDLRELWKRMVFNVCVSNADDHLRNHGFLLNASNSWSLSPVYDINPVPDASHLSLAISDTDKTIDLRLVLEVSGLFRVGKEESIELIRMIQRQVSQNWRRQATLHGIPKNEIDWMHPAFRESERDLAGKSLHPGLTIV